MKKYYDTSLQTFLLTSLSIAKPIDFKKRNRKKESAFAAWSLNWILNFVFSNSHVFKSIVIKILGFVLLICWSSAQTFQNELK